MLLAVSNGTLDLTTGELHPHRREDMITRVLSAAPRCVRSSASGNVYGTSPAMHLNLRIASNGTARGEGVRPSAIRVPAERAEALPYG